MPAFKFHPENSLFELERGNKARVYVPIAAPVHDGIWPGSRAHEAKPSDLDTELLTQDTRSSHLARLLPTTISLDNNTVCLDAKTRKVGLL